MLESVQVAGRPAVDRVEV